MNESYCGICDEYNIPMHNGICSGCGTDFFDEKRLAKESLKVIENCKAKGWKYYPNTNFFGLPIDEAIEIAKKRIETQQ